MKKINARLPSIAELEVKSFWTPREIASYLGVSERFVRDNLARDLPVVYLGERTKLYACEDIFSLLAKKKLSFEAIF